MRKKCANACIEKCFSIFFFLQLSMLKNPSCRIVKYTLMLVPSIFRKGERVERQIYTLLFERGQIGPKRTRLLKPLWLDLSQHFENPSDPYLSSQHILNFAGRCRCIRLEIFVRIHSLFQESRFGLTRNIRRRIFVALTKISVPRRAGSSVKWWRNVFAQSRRIHVKPLYYRKFRLCSKFIQRV